MTKPTPEKLLELANIVEPSETWRMHPEDCFPYCDTGTYFNPLGNDTQLMKVVFKAFVFGWDFNVKGSDNNWSAKIKSHKVSSSGAEVHLYSACGETKQEAIVNLAIEVLT